VFPLKTLPVGLVNSSLEVAVRFVTLAARTATSMIGTARNAQTVTNGKGITTKARCQHVLGMKPVLMVGTSIKGMDSVNNVIILVRRVWTIAGTVLRAEVVMTGTGKTTIDSYQRVFQ
jgi:hypothetical protein